MTTESNPQLPDQANLAKAVREALGLTFTEAGVLLLDHTNKTACTQWTMWETGVKKLSKPTEHYLKLILFLADAKKQKIKGADRALDLFLAQQKNFKD